jgi:hypothetical protein
MAIPAAFYESTDWRALDREVSLFGDTDGWTEEDLLAACHCPEQWLKGATSMWSSVQGVIWTLGESFRRILKRDKRLRRSDRFFQAVESICLDDRFGKGRESFTMLLGHYGGVSRTPVLIRLLDDPDIAGHAVYSLRLLKAAEAAEKVRPFLESPKTWVRNEARKFFQKIEPVSQT